jgi:hypothetical protein
LIKEKLGIEPELVEGGRGEFTVRVNDEIVAKKGWFRFPAEEKIIESVKESLQS